jgi:hypothetical protein
VFHIDAIVLVLLILMSAMAVVYKAFTGWGHPSAPSQTN